MKRPPPPLNFVRSFEAAARHLSFTRAAQELGYTQAAISTHVRSLEQYLGRPLFKRNARSLELTEAGQAYLPTLRQALTQIDAATDAIVTSARAQSVVVSCPMSLAENWLPGVLTGFRAAHPEIEVLVHGTVWERPVDGISDMVLSIHREDEGPRQGERLWTERFMLLCAPDLAEKIARPEDILAHPQITVSGRQDALALMGEALGLSSLAARQVLRTNSSNISLEMAARGLGVVVALASLGQLYLDRGLVVEPFDLRPKSPWSYHMRAAGPRPSAAAQALMTHIREAAVARG